MNGRRKCLHRFAEIRERTRENMRGGEKQRGREWVGGDERTTGGGGGTVIPMRSNEEGFSSHVLPPG